MAVIDGRKRDNRDEQKRARDIGGDGASREERDEADGGGGGIGDIVSAGAETVPEVSGRWSGGAGTQGVEDISKEF